MLVDLGRLLREVDAAVDEPAAPVRTSIDFVDDAVNAALRLDGVEHAALAVVALGGQTWTNGEGS
jgi:hypothetical protein